MYVDRLPRLLVEDGIGIVLRQVVMLTLYVFGLTALMFFLLFTPFFIFPKIIRI